MTNLIVFSNTYVSGSHLSLSLSLSSLSLSFSLISGKQSRRNRIERVSNGRSWILRDRISHKIDSRYADQTTFGVGRTLV